MTLVRDPKKYDVERGTFGAFLYGVARNRIMKHQEGFRGKAYRTRKIRAEFHETHVHLGSMTPARWAEFRERREQVRAAVLELPAEFREAVVLCELEEMSYEEAALSCIVR